MDNIIIIIVLTIISSVFWPLTPISFVYVFQNLYTLIFDNKVRYVCSDSELSYFKYIINNINNRLSLVTSCIKIFYGINFSRVLIRNYAY